MKRIFQFSIDHPLFVNLLTIFFCVAGIVSIFQLNREAFPNINYGFVTVRTVYPGASPQEIEKLITLPLERELHEVSDIKEMKSASLEDMSIISLELEPYVTETEKVVSNIQRAVDRTPDLPDDLEEDPVVTEIESDKLPVVEVSLRGNLSEEELVNHARALEKRFLDIPDVASVVRKGWREKEIWVEIAPRELTKYWISLAQVITILGNTNVNIPGGSLKTSSQEYLVQTSGEFKNSKDVGEVILQASDAGHWVQLKNIAKITDTFAEENLIHRTNGRRSINLTIIKKVKGDIINVVEEVQNIAEGYKKEITSGLEISLVNDFSFYVKRRLNVLISNGFLGFLLINIVLFYFMTPRLAFVTALGIPISLFIAFFAMRVGGITINLLTMFGLIMVLGMLVDDALVVAENTYRYMEKGEKDRNAVLKGIMQVWKPVVSSVLTTIVAFMPLMFMSGTMGKFVWFIPMMVIISLTASLLEAYFVLPSHLAELNRIPPMKKHFSLGTEKAKEFLKQVVEGYVSILEKLIGHRYKVLFAFFLFSLIGIVFFILTPFVLFPTRGVEIFFVRAEAPVGTSLEETAKRFEILEERIQELPKEEVKDFVLNVGIQQNDPNDPLTERFSHIGQIAVYLTPPDERDRSAEEIVESIRGDSREFPGLTYVEFEMMKGGPPVGKPILVRVRGEEFKELEEKSLVVRKYLETIEGVTDIKMDYRAGKEKLLVNVDQGKGEEAGVSLRDIGMAVRAAFEGLVATTIRKTDEEIDIRVRFPEEAQRDRSTLQHILVPNTRQGLIRLPELATFSEGEGISMIRHYDRRRVITVSANVDEDKTTSAEVNRLLTKEFKDPALQFGGEFEETQESLDGLKLAFLLGIFGIFILLATQFNSLWQPFVIMSAIPLGLVGVLIAFWVHNEPKSFLALMGTVGLTGVVVNNSIVLVDFINEARKEGMDRFQSIIEAGRLRFRPVFLTSITTILGLFPLAYGIWGGDPFLKPMALVLVWGIFFGTFLTLIAVPCFHAIADDLLEKLDWMKFWKKT